MTTLLSTAVLTSFSIILTLPAHAETSLETGKVVESVNGAPTLLDGKQAIKVLNTLKIEKEVKLQVKQNGKVHNLTVETR